MTSPYLLLAGLLLSLGFSSAFVLRRRAIDNDDDDSNRLIDALKVIERERRRLVNANNDGYDWPAERRRQARESYADITDRSPGRYADRRYGDSDLDTAQNMYFRSPSAIDDQPPLPPPMEISKADIDSILRELSQDKDEKLMSRNEADDEFVEPTKRTRQRLLKKAPLKKLKLENTIVESKNLSPKLVAEILATVKDTEREATSDSSDDESPNSTIVPASEEELKSVLDEDINDDVENDNDNDTNDELADDDNHDDVLNENTVKEESADHQDDKWPLYSTTDDLGVNKEWAVDGDNKPAMSKKTSAKQKRSQLADAVSPVNVDKLRDILRFVKYEDQENSNLAKALDLATKSQLQDTAKYIPDEIHYLQKAIEAEGELIRLDSNIARRDADETEVTLKRKREDPVEPMALQYGDDDDGDTSEVNNYMIAKWLKEYMQNHVDDTSKATYVNPFLRKLIEKYQGLKEDKRAYIEEEDSEGQFGPNDNIRPDDVRRERQLAVIEAINEYLSSPQGRVNELTTGLDEASLDTGECAVVPLLTDDCARARSKGVRLDREAMDLCNRYELCYKCGSVHGISQDNCNDGYMRESSKLCSFEADQANCERDAVQFFLLLASGRRQIPAEDANYICRATCVRDYIVGDILQK